jgi:hypothetical protein
MDISELKGKVFVKIDVADDKRTVKFYSNEGEIYEMYHDQDCCEDVQVEDINGDLNHLLNYPLIVAEESKDTEHDKEPSNGESFTWTFYKLATIKGFCVIRWYGSSNGYYSEEVSLKKTQDRLPIFEERDKELQEQIEEDLKAKRYHLKALEKAIKQYHSCNLVVPKHVQSQYDALYAELEMNKLN